MVQIFETIFPLKIAQPFRAGSAFGIFQSPARDERKSRPKPSFVPAGLSNGLLDLNPALKRWAIFKTYRAARVAQPLEIVAEPEPVHAFVCGQTRRKSNPRPRLRK